MIVTMVPRENIAHVWLRAGDYIQSAIDATIPDRQYDAFDVFERCITGFYALWIVIDETKGDEVIAAFTTQVAQAPNHKSLIIPWVGGKKGTILRWYQPMLDTMESYARDCGCKYMEGHGRDQWNALLSREGWQKSYIVYEKEIDL